jgi:PST family polysaccharide transporter
MIVGLYGEKWRGAVLPFQILCLAGIPRAIYHLGGAVAYASGNVFAELRRQAVYAALVVVGSLVGTRWGITGVAAGIVIAIIYMYIAMATLASRSTGVRWAEFLRAQVPGAALGSGVGAAALGVRLVLEHLGFPSIAIFGVTVLTCAVATLLGISILPEAWQPTELFRQIGGAIKWMPMPLRSSIHKVLRVPG